MRIYEQQVGAFEQAAWDRFECEMVEHSREFSPATCSALSREQLVLAVRAAIAKARLYGFLQRGPIRLYVELTFLCGTGFDTDPHYGFLGETLRSNGEPMARAENIHTWHNAYLSGSSGEELQALAASLRETRQAKP